MFYSNVMGSSEYTSSFIVQYFSNMKFTEFPRGHALSNNIATADSLRSSLADAASA